MANSHQDFALKRVLYLVRHAHVGRKETFVGHSNIPLSSQGVQKSERWAESIQDLQLDALYCSDLLRATQTAGPLLDRWVLEPRLMADLRERNMGDWEGLSWEEVEKNIRRPPGTTWKTGREPCREERA